MVLAGCYLIKMLIILLDSIVCCIRYKKEKNNNKIFLPTALSLFEDFVIFGEG